MLRFVSYVIVAMLLAIAMVSVIPLVEPVGASSTVAHGPVQSVNRAHKGDRLSLPVASGKSQPPRQLPTIMVGCEPVFSPLSASARANFSSRCIV